MSITRNAQETQELASQLAKKILAKKPGKTAVVLCLRGQLGAGKTTFLQGFAKELGVEEVVNSPTFVIMKHFSIDAGGFEHFYHIDCYRLEREDEILALGFAEIISNPKNIVAIEWPEKISKLLPPDAPVISFHYTGENTRNISIGRLAW
jgi:tRNA threonylcarbamoyladenosine biosynthesis protein TsaE